MTASSPSRAAEISRQYADNIDLLIADVIMPGERGPALYSRLLRERPTLKALYMSGYTANVVLRHDLSSPPAGFIDKPFLPSVIARKVREVLDGTPEPAPEPPRALVASREAALVGTLQEILWEQGCSLAQAVEEAGLLVEIERIRPRLLFLDREFLPQENLDLFQRIRKAHPGIGIILLTEPEDEGLGRRGVQLGALDYLLKPLNRETLLRMIWWEVMSLP